MAKSEYRKPLYYATAVSLMAGSILAVGEMGEVVFRISATMPALFVLMCFVMKIVLDRKKKQGVKNRVCAVMIFVTMALGAVTPVIEYIRAIEAIQERGTVCAVADDLKTLNSEDAPENFIGYQSDIRIPLPCQTSDPILDHRSFCNRYHRFWNMILNSRYDSGRFLSDQWGYHAGY